MGATVNARSHRLRVAGGIPMLAVRALLLLVSVGSVALLDPFPLWLWIAVATAVAGAVLPGSFAAWGPIASIGATLLTAAPAPGRTAIALLAVHLIHVLASLTWTIPWRSRVRLDALLPSLGRLVLIQLVVQPLVLGIGLLPRITGAGFEWLAPLGALAVVAAAVLLRRAHDGRSAPGDGANVRGPS